MDLKEKKILDHQNFPEKRVKRKLTFWEELATETRDLEACSDIDLYIDNIKNKFTNKLSVASPTSEPESKSGDYNLNWTDFGDDNEKENGTKSPCFGVPFSQISSQCGDDVSDVPSLLFPPSPGHRFFEKSNLDAVRKEREELANIHREARGRYGPSPRMFMAEWKGSYKKCRLCGSKYWVGFFTRELSRDEKAEELCHICLQGQRMGFGRSSEDISSSCGEEEGDGYDSTSGNAWGLHKEHIRSPPWACVDALTKDPVISSVSKKRRLDWSPSPSPELESVDCGITDNALDGSQYVGGYKRSPTLAALFAGKTWYREKLNDPGFRG